MQTMSSGVRWWFESLDRTRRERGTRMDALGLGPQETPSKVELSLPGVRLLSYRSEATPDPTAPVALIVPAPIKQHYIWDLAPEYSVVQHLLRDGVEVYLAQWTEPPEADSAGATLGLEAYSDGLIGACVDAIQKQLGARSIFLLSHSLGGVLATLYSALHPDKVAGLVLVETPLHFGAAAGSFVPMLQFGPGADRVSDTFGDRVPGSVLSTVSGLASPGTFHAERFADFFASFGSPDAMRSHLLVERWTLDEAAMSARLFEQVVEDLYRGDRLMSGTLDIRGRQLGPRDLKVPVLAVYDPRSVVIPPESVIAFHEAAASEEKRLLQYDGDTGVALSHVGGLVGANAHSRLWPEIVEWVRGLNKRTAQRH